MNPPDIRTLRRAGAAFWLLLLAALATVAVWLVLRVHQGAQRQLDDIEPRFARMLGLIEQRAALEKAATDAGAELARHSYPAARDVSQAGNDAQQRARDVFAKAGMDVISSQVLAAREGRRFDRVPVSLRLEGDMAALQAALAALPAQTPTLYVEGFTVQGAPSPRNEAEVRLGVQIDLYVLRLRP